jgi:predicted amidohydrolase YtcJ
MQPAAAMAEWRIVEARLGGDRLGGAYAWATMLRQRVPLAFGSGVPAARPDPFAGMAAALTRTDAAGQPAGGWHVQEAVTLAQALRAFTQGAARAGFAEDRMGSLMPGHLADFVILDRDPMTAAPADLRATQVLETWIGGQRAWVRK